MFEKKYLFICLYPFSIIYSAIIRLRNYFYDKKIFHSVEFDLPIICVGNLAVGGTGKTPMIEFLINFLSEKNNIVVLSRGYKRKTKGYIEANENSTSEEIGDEPFQIFKKFPDIRVVVCENRLIAIPQILSNHPSTNLILLDDAFQHRSVKAGLNILLTRENNLFSTDFCLPSGKLRDNRNQYKRADIIVVTGSSKNISHETKHKIQQSISPLSHQHLFFSFNEYEECKNFLKSERLMLDNCCDVLLITGIANSEILVSELKPNVNSLNHLKFSDHHQFSEMDIKNLKLNFEKISSNKKIIITTAKDATRLEKWKTTLTDLPIFILPVKLSFAESDNEQFKKNILNFIQKFNN